MEWIHRPDTSLTAGRPIGEHCGLTLSTEEAAALERRETDALRQNGRVAFDSILRLLTAAFCDSPYIQPQDRADTLAELTDIFYVLKNETGDALGDEALLAAMAARFNGAAGGSLDALAATEPHCLLRLAGEGRGGHD